jgi:hypothetical protein
MIMPFSGKTAEYFVNETVIPGLDNQYCSPRWNLDTTETLTFVVTLFRYRYAL